MIQITSCILVVACAVFVLGVDFHPEGPCNQVGGLCVLKSKCKDSTFAEGLCPEQQSQGAECCDRVPASDKRCSSYGGSCEDTCPPKILRSDLHCTSGQSCCIYLT